MDEIVTFGRWVLLATLFTYFGGQESTAIMGLITIATTIAGPSATLSAEY